MVLAIIFLTLFFILIALFLLFLILVLIPKINQQTNVHADVVFSEHEKKFSVPTEEKIEVSENRAIVLCSSNKKFSTSLTRLNSMQTCSLVNAVYLSGNDCRFSCIGLGDCIKVCPQEAIYIKNHTAVVSELCVGCGKCVDVCPKGLIKLLPKDTKKAVVCSCSEHTLTTCDKLGVEEKIERSPKKGFKIWDYCYKLIRHTSKDYTF